MVKTKVVDLLQIKFLFFNIDNLWCDI